MKRTTCYRRFRFPMAIALDKHSASIRKIASGHRQENPLPSWEANPIARKEKSGSTCSSPRTMYHPYHSRGKRQTTKSLNIQLDSFSRCLVSSLMSFISANPRRTDCFRRCIHSK
ncbi:hypothetical protein PV11_06324 [Exophiala sideris]|uniref:Uncharacterized protein n=1 Tax=Exophiala sideris TaxID=1016849 RepID=A0A0D1YD04_9EURO|nr:hypothetical protein PV11_06324 [Exophiala sideris]